MNIQTILLMMITLFITSCGSAPQTSGSKRIAAKDSEGKTLKDSSTEELSGKAKEKEKQKQKEKEEEEEEEEEEEIDKEDDEDAKTKKVAKEKEKEKEEEEKKAKELAKKTTPMTVTTIRSEDDDLILKVKNSEGKWISVPWPARGASATSEAICGEKETVVEIQIEHPGKGTINPGTPFLGVVSKVKNTIEIGYEVDGSCNGTGCQDDNVVVLSCPNGISVKGM